MNEECRIIKFISFVSLCLLPLCLLLPAEAKPERPVPIIVCDETEFFFGSATNTETITHEFVLSNEGTGVLHIRAVRTDCGCVAARLGNDALAPGESAALKVQLNLKGRSGRQLRRIIVESNDRDQPRLVLAVAGEAIAPLEIMPDQIYWGNVHVSAAVEKSCEIKFSEGDESYVNSVVPPMPCFAAELVTIRPRRHYKITIRTVPPLTVGSFQSALKVMTDHPRFKTIEIPMQGRFVGDIYAIPGEIAVKSPDGRPVARTLLIYSGLKKKFKLLRVELPRPDMEARIRPMAMANGYRVELRNIIPSRDLNETNIVIVTDCDTTPALIVPFRAPPD